MEDFGTQKGMMIAPGTFSRLVAPYYMQLFDWIHRNTSWKIFFHSCGGIYPIIQMLIDCGVDILNPVQTTAAGMNLARLKAQFGRQIVFWGGGIDTQTILPFGSAEEVVSAKGPLGHSRAGRGFVFVTSHNIQQDSLWRTLQRCWLRCVCNGKYEH
jgi:uroporphyrinogen-III decarboxylase